MTALVVPRIFERERNPKNRGDVRWSRAQGRRNGEAERAAGEPVVRVAEDKATRRQAIVRTTGRGS